uniref:Uncharacterized protein n=1 Tax=Arundo donax TaxID=35708 RepID=A0A0A9ES29_ARUDO
MLKTPLTSSQLKESPGASHHNFNPTTMYCIYILCYIKLQELDGT